MSEFFNITINHSIFGDDTAIEVMASGTMTEPQRETPSQPEIPSYCEELEIEIVSINGRKYGNRILKMMEKHLWNNYEKKLYELYTEQLKII